MPGPAGGSSGPSLRKALEVFDNRNYRFLWLSSLFSFSGLNMQMIARGLLAWHLSESYAVVGVISGAFGLPMLLLSLVGGAVADRVDKRNLALMTQTVSGVLSLLTAVMIVTDTITIEILFVLGLVQGAFFALGMPARSPLMALIVGPQRLMSAMALSNASMNGTRLVGPALAGVLAVISLAVPYFVQSGLYALSVTFLLLVPSGLGASDRPRQNMLVEIGQGVRYASTEPRVRVLVMMGFILAFFGMPYMMLLPGFVQEDLGQGPDAVGWLQSVSAIGALVGSLVIATLSDFPRKPLLQLIAGILGGVGLVLFGLGSLLFGYLGAMVAILMLGTMLNSYQTLNMAMVMESSDPQYYGRVMSIMMLTFSSVSLMAAPLGAIADLVGATTLFMVEGGLIVVAMLLVSLLNPGYIFGRTEPTSYSWPSVPGEGAAAAPTAGRPAGPPHAEGLAGPSSFAAARPAGARTAAEPPLDEDRPGTIGRSDD